MNQKARWLALICLTGINLLNYIDRYIFSALLPAIKADLGFTDTELGILGSAFLFAYVFASPVFGYWGDRGSRSKIMSLGVGLWSVATAFSGVATQFIGQFVTRAAVGLGESAYSVIAPSTIADHFSKMSRGKVFAIYSGAIPVGSALGYVIGGWLEPRIGWHKAFMVVGVPGIALALILYFLPDPKRGGAEEAGADDAPKRQSTRTTYLRLFRNGGFLTTVLGYAAYTFVVGGMAFWMPSYLVREFNVSLEDANVKFGALTVAGGFIGTLLGGWWSDVIERHAGNGFLKVSFLSMVFSVPLFFFTLSLTNFNEFLAALFVLEVAMFMCISPLDAAVISYVQPAARSTAMALNVFLIHVLGDGISRTLMGVVSDASGLRAAILILPWALVIAGLFWLVGIVFFWQAAVWPVGSFKMPRWQAHRGYRPDATVVENTLPAFQSARAAGAEMFECDVRLSKDFQAVVFHDNDLNRIAKRPELVAELTAKELRQIANIPTLADALTDLRCPQLVNIELKTAAVWRGDGLEEAVIRAVQFASAERRVLFSSFNPFALHRLAKLAPQIPRALLATEVPDNFNKIYFRKLWLGALARPHVLNLGQEMITAERVESWRERGLRVVAWTVNDRKRAHELLEMGAAGVISDTMFSDESYS